MRYIDFEDAFSSDRMSKYVTACNGDTRKAMTLYRYPLQLSQELFTVVSCFEITQRIRIDNQLKARCVTSSFQAVYSIQIFVLTRLARLLTMHIVNWFGNRTTATRNCCRRWSSASGNIYILMSITP